MLDRTVLDAAAVCVRLSVDCVHCDREDVGGMSESLPGHGTCIASQGEVVDGCQCHAAGKLEVDVVSEIELVCTFSVCHARVCSQAVIVVHIGASDAFFVVTDSFD